MRWRWCRRTTLARKKSESRAPPAAPSCPCLPLLSLWIHGLGSPLTYSSASERTCSYLDDYIFLALCRFCQLAPCFASSHSCFRSMALLSRSLKMGRTPASPSSSSSSFYWASSLDSSWGSCSQSAGQVSSCASSLP